jgi:hypothetical protein
MFQQFVAREEQNAFAAEFLLFFGITFADPYKAEVRCRTHSREFTIRVRMRRPEETDAYRCLLKRRGSGSRCQ